MHREGHYLTIRKSIYKRSPEKFSSFIHSTRAQIRLEGDDANTGALLDNGADTRRSVDSVLVWDGQAAGLGDLGRAVDEEVVLLDGETLLVRVEVGDNGLGDVGERVRLDKDLGTHARVDA